MEGGNAQEVKRKIVGSTVLQQRRAATAELLFPAMAVRSAQTHDLLLRGRLVLSFHSPGSGLLVRRENRKSARKGGRQIGTELLRAEAPGDVGEYQAVFGRRFLCMCCLPGESKKSEAGQVKSSVLKGNSRQRRRQNENPKQVIFGVVDLVRI